MEVKNSRANRKMASIRRYKDGRVAIVGDYCAGSPFVRQKWVRGEKRTATREEGKSGIWRSPMEIGDGNLPLHHEERPQCLAKEQYRCVDG